MPSVVVEEPQTGANAVINVPRIPVKGDYLGKCPTLAKRAVELYPDLAYGPYEYRVLEVMLNTEHPRYSDVNTIVWVIATPDEPTFPEAEKARRRYNE